MEKCRKESIEKVKGKLQAEGIDFQDYDKAVIALSHCVQPGFCIFIYKDYIYKGDK